MADENLVVIGAGQAGSELAVAARQQGWSGRITLLGEEPSLPYQRPPLSKKWLAGQTDDESLLLRPVADYAASDIALRTGVRALAIDRDQRRVQLADGSGLDYDRLALCTGGQPRPLACAGIDAAQPPANLHLLRTKADAARIRAGLVAGARLVVIGGGYIGLEVAATARALGVTVTVLEVQPRVLARVTSELVSRFYEDVHRVAGVDVQTNVQLEGVDVEAGRVTAVRCRTPAAPAGMAIAADLVIAGLGMLPNVALARAAGLEGEAGIVVDELGRTADPHIVAAGDCTWQVCAAYDREMRIESVPNALEQARAAASGLVGKPKPNRALPWFWSDQYDLKLQTAGIHQGHDQVVLRGDPVSRSFCVLYLQGDRLLAADAINRPVDFMGVRRLLAQPVALTAAELADESVPLLKRVPR